jgi:Mycolic acid cyclopropane synthetase
VIASANPPGGTIRAWRKETASFQLDCWSDRFERVVPAVLEKFDERFVRMWRLYLRASSAAFREGVVKVHQILVSRGQATDFPLTRKDIYAGGECHPHR